MGELNKEYEASLKSIETENIVDKIFYRPIGFRIACLLRNTGITPNMVTIISIFIGASVGFLFYSDNLIYNIYGILLLISANILDCVDGQLARLTGIKSAIGRILDGIAGDIWFTCIYVNLALRLSLEYGTYWFFVLAVASGLSHLVQANIIDYYKTLHLYFISKEKGAEFQTLEQVREQHKETRPGLNKAFYLLYKAYTSIQVNATPILQLMLKNLHKKYGNDIPEDIRIAFRKKSCRLMPLIDLMTFNGRTIIMFIVILSGYVWAYFLYEIIVLNIVLAIVMKKHEKICASFL
ncbi:MAG: CDP-alcohol phosphatidyltransferase family protein [Tannerellaceae bacterium]|nr:CDP-alcohol phosphatidyltransferase family protein [Tannerellaceae bacterium]